MPDTKLTALTAATALSNDDLLYVVDDPAGTPVSKKITVSNARTALLTADGMAAGIAAAPAKATPVNADSFLLVDSAASNAGKEVTIAQLFDTYFGRDLSAAGFQKLATGLIIQWVETGTDVAINNGINITFPVAFPNAALAVVATFAIGSDTEYAVACYRNLTTTGVRINNGNADTAADRLSVLAVGY